MQAASLDTDRVLKEWMLKRNCAISPRQLVTFYVSLAAVSIVIALTVAIRGAWLVLPFTGIDLLAVGVAFIVYARHASDYEYIRLSPERLMVELCSAERLTRHEFNPQWVRVDVEGLPRARIVLRSGRQSVTVGGYLAVDRREPFARELRGWLSQCA